jgi:hypothetical protein
VFACFFGLDVTDFGVVVHNLSHTIHNNLSECQIIAMQLSDLNLKQLKHFHNIFTLNYDFTWSLRMMYAPKSVILLAQIEAPA